MNATQLYIDGQYCDATSNEAFADYNPATGELLAHIQTASLNDVDKAVAAAKRGFAVWSAMTGTERGRILQKAVAILRERNDELAMIEVLDTGKPIQEADCVDIATGADVIEYYAGLAATISGQQQDLGGTNFYYTRREPLGVCAGIGAWNYPIQIAMWKSGPALAAGNAMIFKPSEETPLGALKLAEIYTQAGLPDGVFNVVQGDGEIGQALSRHPEIAKVSFTGECGTGKKVMADAASTLKEVTMELGGKSAFIAFEDADIENAVSGALLANFYTQGEVCTNGTRVFVHASIYDQFIEKIKARTEKIIIGDPTHADTQVGALISKDHMQKVLGYIEAAKAAGATLVCGGEQVTENGLDRGNFVQPTVFADCTDDMPNTIDEIFGPVMSILKFDTEEEVIERANNTEFGLANGIFTTNISRAHRVIAKLEAGICFINTWGASPAQMPVGGYKQSGIGRENGIDTLNQYTQVKSVFIELGDVECPY
ncbi:betaine-aldehyde dehydrogenase [Oceanospirillaceae bacterium]|nr:betaine-aldehyde dehydrogenase [Oceanospirillaceae bacterium]MDC0085705.1 betaine-aldehyde dehydrogenase [Oceanospirillaceae bacterium]MDC1351244.1 betaine-aldehyde dehydrogenase [Oceanospirillaceae bacterium]MDC1424622.1 betaine-aldehyde dehydrogenase [Oceanospirillaceae bacterium]